MADEYLSRVACSSLKPSKRAYLPSKLVGAATSSTICVGLSTELGSTCLTRLRWGDVARDAAMWCVDIFAARDLVGETPPLQPSRRRRAYAH